MQLLRNYRTVGSMHLFAHCRPYETTMELSDQTGNSRATGTCTHHGETAPAQAARTAARL
jgi:hypothetical protein